MTMRERIARAMAARCIDAGAWTPHAYEELAGVAIAAMREPTATMVKAAGEPQADETWRSMIAAALAETPE